jgi:hypothetical protein
MDDLPWWWADSSDNNAIKIAGLRLAPQGKNPMVDTNHKVFPCQEVTSSFIVPRHGK